ncbi:MAG: RNA polymerase sigma-I factor [Neobacillus sp.]
MLGLLFMTKSKKRTLEESVILIQQGNRSLLNETIDAYKPETDDEFSIGLIAFNEAIEKYSPEKGKSLLSFSEVLIKRRVIDYIRKQSRNNHISMDLTYSSLQENTVGIGIINDLSLEEYKKKSDEELRKEEITQFQLLLKTYDLSFSDLVQNSPKHADARENAILVARKLVEDTELKKILFEKKRLPIKELEKMVNISRKTIERNRKYIIAIALILSSDYVFMKEYLKGVLEI